MLSLHSFVSSSPHQTHDDYNDDNLTNELQLLGEKINSILFEMNNDREDYPLAFVRDRKSLKVEEESPSLSPSQPQPSSSHIVRKLKMKLMEPLKNMHSISSRLR